MKTVQETFKAVIDGGFYTAESERHFESYKLKSSQFMCVALGLAKRNGVISDSEEEFAYEEIQCYLATKKIRLTTLDSSLEDSGLPCGYSDRVAVYMDWGNRPKLN